MAAHGDEITMTEGMTEATMTVTITAGHTGGGHHRHTTAEGATDPGPDPDPTHLVAIKA